MPSNIELIFGDCLPALKNMADNSFDLAIVDPPYGIGRAGHKLSLSKNRNKQWQKYYKDKGWDNSIPSREYFLELRRVSKNQIIWGGNYFTDFLPPSRGWISWYKEQNDLSMSDMELAWTSFDVVARQFSLHRSLLWREGTIHPTQKPVRLYSWIINKYASPHAKILDTHLGSGSIALACYDMGFDLTAFEIDQDYYDMASKRLDNHKRQLTFI